MDALKELEALHARHRKLVEEHVARLDDPIDQIVFLTGTLHMAIELREHVTKLRNGAVFDAWKESGNGGESLSEVARRVGVSRQALNKIAMIEKAERGEM